VLWTLEQPPLRPGSLDGVLLLDVLEHLEDDARGLAQAARLLKPGGALVVTVPAGPSLWGRQDEVSHHYRRYTRRDLLSLFARAGLARPELTHFNTFLYPPIAAIRWGRRLLGLKASDQSDFEGSHPGPVNDLLERIMAAERHLLGRVPLPVGVSLLGLLHAR
jgi:SAM-dependent methyltransferase